MKLFEIQMTMQRIREARAEWSAKHREVNEVAARSMRRLLHEAIAQRMSVEDVAKYSGYTKARIRQMMRGMDLEPRWSKTMLAKTAAEALRTNAELLGIDPVDMDLMSPLAYLPAGSQLRSALDSEAVRGVTEVPEIEVDPSELTEEEREVIAECVARFGATNGDLYPVVQSMIRARLNGARA